jgi:ribose transport system substrate-binding protein
MTAKLATPIVGAVLALAALVGCGSEGSDTASTPAATRSSSAATGSNSSAAVQASNALVARFERAQPAIELPALSKRPPANLTVALVSCPLPICQTVNHASAAAAEALGWKLKEYDTQITPEGYAATWQRVVGDRPDLIVYAVLLPNQLITKQLAQVKAEKIPAVGLAPGVTDKPSAAGPMVAAYSGTPMMTTDGKLMGDVVVSNAGGAATTVFITDPQLKLQFGAVQSEFTKAVGAAGGSVDVLNVRTQDIGRTIPTAVVSYVQRHPDVKYLAFALNDLTAGVPEALRGAGLSDKVRIVARAPQQANLKAIADGDQYAAVADEDAAGVWRAFDALARIVIGDPLSADLRYPDGWHQIFRKNTVDPSKPLTTPGVPDAFLAAWHVQG